MTLLPAPESQTPSLGTPDARTLDDRLNSGCDHDERSLTAMSSPWVIKLPLAQDAGGALLVHVTPKDSKPLDLDLLATDGESAFKGKGGRCLFSQVYAANVLSEKPKARAAAAYKL